MSQNSSTPVPDRIFASLPYLLPFMACLQFGWYLLFSLRFLAILLNPLKPLRALYDSVPFAGLIIFFILLFAAVVKNNNISRFIRFNTMQAILLNILVAITGWVVLGITAYIRIYAVHFVLFNMVFVGTLAAVIYCVVQSSLGRYTEIPRISQAVDQLVR